MRRESGRIIELSWWRGYPTFTLLRHQFGEFSLGCNRAVNFLVPVIAVTAYIDQLKVDIFNDPLTRWHGIVGFFIFIDYGKIEQRYLPARVIVDDVGFKALEIPLYDF